MITNPLTGIPIVGIDANGNSIMLAGAADGTSSATANTLSAGLTSDIWSTTQINSFFKNSSGVVIGLGTGVDSRGITRNLVWVQTSDGWKISDSGINGYIRPNGIEFGSTWTIANSSAVMSSDFSLTTPAPAGGFATNNSTVNIVANVTVDGLNNNGSTIVATSINIIGAWTSGNAWAHSPGPVTQIPTGHLETTYTFPGYTGANAQVQYANTVVSSANVASYGLMGSPQISVTWPA